MIDWEQYKKACKDVLRKDLDKNPEQEDAIGEWPDKSLYIVAGPGSGKTTGISLRVLKLIYVDSIDPASIMVTTFTKKAAAELRSRILGWGDQLRQAFMKNSRDEELYNKLRWLDFNTIITGTIDSIIVDMLTEYREPGTASPDVIEDFVSNALMVNEGLFDHGRFQNKELKDYIAMLRGSRYDLNVPSMSETLLEVKDRFSHDQVDINEFKQGCKSEGVCTLCDAIQAYNDFLSEKGLFDFTTLETHFLMMLREGRLEQFRARVRYILVDEYQDTNLLQEQIYFEIANTAAVSGGSFTVVGDDDQSLYRFRGATVDLFTAFPSRVSTISISPRTIWLHRNYRSTQTIVKLCNEFVELDSSYKDEARVRDKPAIITERDDIEAEYPILALFCKDREELAEQLAKLIHQVVRRGGFKVKCQDGNQFVIKISRAGSAGDIALLSSSPREYNSGGKEMLPLLLRQRLSEMIPEIMIFNPRGQSLKNIEDVQLLCGLILRCIDPDGSVQNEMQKLSHDGVTTLNNWRETADRYIKTNPSPNKEPHSLRRFVDAWRTRTKVEGGAWDRHREDVPLVELVYKLVTWIPCMQDDKEGLVYLEAITRTFSQAALFCDFESHIIFDVDHPDLEQASKREAIRKIMMPLALGVIDINEDLLETMPTDRLNIMSIHQAKGLQFPLVIVDVGSEFDTEHPSQRFKRFPEKSDKTCTMEDCLREYSSLGKPERNAIDRSFDDLIRKAFVAYSRPQDVLLLVGLRSVSNGYRISSGIKYIPNVATGWDRKREWIWGPGLHNLIHIERDEHEE